MLKKGSDSTEKMELPRVQRKLAPNEVGCGFVDDYGPERLFRDIDSVPVCD